MHRIFSILWFAPFHSLALNSVCTLAWILELLVLSSMFIIFYFTLSIHLHGILGKNLHVRFLLTTLFSYIAFVIKDNSWDFYTSILSFFTFSYCFLTHLTCTQTLIQRSVIRKLTAFLFVLRLILQQLFGQPISFPGTQMFSEIFSLSSSECLRATCSQIIAANSNPRILSTVMVRVEAGNTTRVRQFQVISALFP